MSSKHRSHEHHRLAHQQRAAQVRAERWATEGGPVGRRTPRRWPSHVVGATAALLTVVEAVAVVLLALALPGAIADAHRYRAAPDCVADGSAAHCLAVRPALVVQTHLLRSRSTHPTADVEDPDTHAARTLNFDDTTPVLSLLAPGDTIQVASWHGSPVAIRYAGQSQDTDNLPLDNQCVELAALAAALLLLPATGRTAHRLLRDREPEPFHHTEAILFAAATFAIGIPLLPGTGADLAMAIATEAVLLTLTAAAVAWDRARGNTRRRYLTH